MVTNSVFKSVVVTGDSKEDAIKKSPFNQIIVDATAAYTAFLEKKLGFDKTYRKTWMEKHKDEKVTPADYRAMLIDKAAVTDAEFREWQIAYSHDKSKDIPNIGCMIVINPAVESTRKRPYEYTNYKNEGKRKTVTVVEIVNKRTNEVIWHSDKHITKAEAIKKAKAILSKGEVKDSLTLRLAGYISNPILGELTYVPSKGASTGKFIIFGQVDGANL